MTKEIAHNIFGTILGGVALTILYYAYEEVIMRPTNLTGIWEMNSLIQEASLDTFVNMELKYLVFIVDADGHITGTGEKIGEKLSDRQYHEYEKKERTSINIDGFFEKRFLLQNKLFIILIEYGKRRETRTSLQLHVVNNHQLTGTMISTAANSCGTVTLNRKY